MATVLTAESRRLSTLGNAWPQGIYKVVFKLPKSIISRIFFTVYFTIITCVIIFGFFSGLLLCFKTKKRKCFKMLQNNQEQLSSRQIVANDLRNEDILSMKVEDYIALQLENEINSINKKTEELREMYNHAAEVTINHLKSDYEQITQQKEASLKNSQ